MFQVIEAGETVTASVNAAKTYKLHGVATAHVTALQGFKYTTGTIAPTSLNGLAFCESSSSSAVITPDQSKVAA
jgi:deuterolysin